MSLCLYGKFAYSQEVRLGHSKKGWTDGEIGIEWIKQFDKQTKVKANGHARTLLVDGHTSHYTREFLKYAQEHKIHILCYPSHVTHVYQGLDVVIFSVLKCYWAEERLQWHQEKGENVTKKNFLAIYGATHLRALMPDLISKAFKKTGVWPYNPAVVTADMMAPSKETSRQVTLPIVPPMPVRVVTKLIREVPERAATSEEDLSIVHEEGSADMDPSSSLPAQVALSALKSTMERFLVSDSPSQARAHLPLVPLAPITPKSQNTKLYHNILNEVPQT